MLWPEVKPSPINIMNKMLLEYRVKAGKRSSRAQSMLEYSVIIACVIAALIGMQIYIKRGIQGRLQEVSDGIGQQYAPTNITTNITTELTSDTTTNSTLIPLTYPKDPEDPPEEPAQPIEDEFGLSVYGIDTETEINETVTRSGSEELEEFEDVLF